MNTSTKNLLLSIESNDLECFCNSIALGANINSRELGGWTPLHIAASQNEISIQIIQILIREGAQIDAKDDEGWTPLHGAAWEGHESVVTTLLDAGADYNLVNRSGESPIDLARQAQHDKVVEIIGSRYQDIKEPACD